MTTAATLALSTIFLITVAAFGFAFYYLMLPTVLKGIAASGRFIAHLEENGIIFVVAGKSQNGKFVRSVTGSKLFHIPDPTSANGSIIDSPPPQDHVSGRFERWLIRCGYIWIGFFNYNSTLSITKTRKNADTDKKLPIEKIVEYIPNQTITYLKRDFVIYVKIDNIETDDAFEATMVVLAHAKVICPYKAWFGKGGKAYETIFTEVEITVRELVEAMTLDYMYRGGKKKLPDGTEVDSDGISDLKEQLKEGVKDREKTIKELGVDVPLIEIVDWGDNAPPAFREGVQAVTLEEQVREGKVQKLITRQTVAREEVKSLDEEAKKEKAQAAKNAETRKAYVELAGGKEGEGIADTLVLSREMDPATFIEHRRAQARERTGIQTLVEGGSPPSVLIPAAAPAEKPKEVKEKK